MGFGRDGHCKVMDFGHAFEAQTGASYSRANFSEAMALPPELGPGDSTTDPFKVDSWVLGQAVRCRTPTLERYLIALLTCDEDILHLNGWWQHFQPRVFEIRRRIYG